jgi:hypothetical protein
MRQSRTMRFQRAMLAPLLMAILPAASAAPERITFIIRHVGVVCTGICPHFAVTVSKDGSVIERTFRVYDKEDGPARSTRRFHISPAAVDVFFNELAPYRTVSNIPAGGCYPELEADDVIPGLSPYEIRGERGDRVDLLSACGNDEFRWATQRALVAISIDPYSGERLRASLREFWSECFARRDPSMC